MVSQRKINFITEGSGAVSDMCKFSRYRANEEQIPVGTLDGHALTCAYFDNLMAPLCYSCTHRGDFNDLDDSAKGPLHLPCKLGMSQDESHEHPKSQDSGKVLDDCAKYKTSHVDCTCGMQKYLG